MALTLKGREQYGQLFFLDNTIESTSDDIDIQIGITSSSADLKLNRNVVLAPEKTFGLVDTVTGDIARLSVTGGVLNIDGANQLQVGQLKFVDNTIESTSGTIDIQIGVTSSTADLVLNTDVKITQGKSITFGDNTIQTTAYVPAATTQRTPANPSTTTSLTGVMMGLSASITPTKTGTILILISGDIDNNTDNDGVQLQIRTGTGTPPINGATPSGTAQGGLVKMQLTRAGNDTILTRVPFSLNAIQTSLTLNTPVWIDISLAAITGGTARVRDISISVVEL